MYDEMFDSEDEEDEHVEEISQKKLGNNHVMILM